jgi:betaine-aldehyde dehydrogenase
MLHAVLAESDFSPQASWGGMKKSSIDRELGPWGLHAFQEIKHVVTAVFE